MDLSHSSHRKYNTTMAGLLQNGHNTDLVRFDSELSVVSLSYSFFSNDARKMSRPAGTFGKQPGRGREMVFEYLYCIACSFRTIFLFLCYVLELTSERCDATGWKNKCDEKGKRCRLVICMGYQISVRQSIYLCCGLMLTCGAINQQCGFFLPSAGPSSKEANEHDPFDGDPDIQILKCREFSINGWEGRWLKEFSLPRLKWVFQGCGF
ncbi:hypothetical protein AVEN_257404-1 [Araneus ventricosus]|uniref:Uncharacterized protein n=1 Tax=Araneus ventricosus TaxID=182803 RepID=A0A4Y2NLJ8_ARAVE|nr:hypothetical protein AVEN_257404-1 [Araneus ventricosus]